MLNVCGWVIRKSLNYRGGTRYKSCRLEAGCKSKTILWARHSEPRRPCGGRMARKINTAAKASLRKALTKGFLKMKVLHKSGQTNKPKNKTREERHVLMVVTYFSPFGLCKSGWLIQNQTVLRLSDEIFKGLKNALTSYYRFWMV